MGPVSCHIKFPSRTMSEHLSKQISSLHALRKSKTLILAHASKTDGCPTIRCLQTRHDAVALHAMIQEPQGISDSF